MRYQRRRVWWSTALVVGLFACDASDDSATDGTDGTTTDTRPADLDWFTSSCGDLGGVETPAGACFIGCRTSADCGLDTLRCTGTSVWMVGQCEVTSELADTRGCGPRGWYDRSWGCYMQCFEGNDAECPSGFRCVEDSIVDGEYFCTGYAGGGTGDCNVPCESGCCSTTGNSCCRPPFCSGVCAGSPCC